MKNEMNKNSPLPPVEPRNNHHYNISFQNFHFDIQDLSFSSKDNQSPNGKKNYDYSLKFLLVGDSDVGKEEILNGLENDNSTESFYCKTKGVNNKSTFIYLDGKRIKIQLWIASGQGRFSTIIRSYSRGAQGILLVYDITNKWSFLSLNNWLQEIEEHAPGVPKILIGNRLHLAFNRQVNSYKAESYALKHKMSFFEISPLCNYNVRESFTELTRIILNRHGMENFKKPNTVLSLQELCCKTILSIKIKTKNIVYTIEQLPIPETLKIFLKSYLPFCSDLNSKKYIYSYKCNNSKYLKCIYHASLIKKVKSFFR